MGHGAAVSAGRLCPRGASCVGKRDERRCAGLEGLPRLDARMCIRSSRSGVRLGNALSERQGSDNDPARLDGVRPCGRGACGAIHPLGRKVQEGKVIDSFNANILSDEAFAGGVVVGTGISAALLLFFQQSFERVLPYLVIAADGDIQRQVLRAGKRPLQVYQGQQASDFA